MKKQLKTNYKLGGILLLIAILAIIFPTVSSASLQSRPGVTSLTNKTASDFFKLCREMETSNGPLGLSATIEVQDNKVVETSASNGIDVHMIKSTEYGTAAMLAASAYGYCFDKWAGSAYNSTTNNDSGIMQMDGGIWEFIVGISNETRSETEKYIKYISTADAKYKNVYDNNGKLSENYIPGDAIYECSGWQGRPGPYYVSNWYPIYIRSQFGVFENRTRDGSSDREITSRAALVCGEGF